MAGLFERFFPYEEFKPQQLQVMEFVYGIAGEDCGVGLVEAYCGFGKTIATFAPVFERGKKVLLLSPTHVARNAGIAEALRINRVNGKRLMVADLRSRGVMCGKFSEQEFGYEKCREARKHGKCAFYSSTKIGKELSSRAKRAVAEIKEIVFDSPERLFPGGNMRKEPFFFKEFREICAEKGLCFYEAMKQVVKEADVIVLDYYWCFTEIFDLLKAMIEPKDFVLLVDEADLLVDRLYNSLHAKMGLPGLVSLVGQAKKIVKAEKSLHEGEKTINAVDFDFLEEFLDLTAEILRSFPKEEALSPDKIISFYEKGFRQTSLAAGLKGTIGFEGIVARLEGIVFQIDEGENSEKARAKPHLFLEKLFSVKDSERHLTFIPRSGKEILVKPFEIENEVLGSMLTAVQTLKEFHGAVLFSATIGDEKLFLEEFGLDKKTRVLKLENIPHKRLSVLIDTELDSTFKNRGQSAPKYAGKVRAMLEVDSSLLVSCCNQLETGLLLKAVPGIENGQEHENFASDRAYAINIRTKHARSTNKAGKVRNCIVAGLPLPDYSDFFFKKRKEYLEKKYGKEHAGKLINRKAVDTAVQLMGRITRDLTSPKLMVLADSRYWRDFFLRGFYYKSIPDYFKPYIKIVKNNEELKQQMRRFWKKA